MLSKALFALAVVAAIAVGFATTTFLLDGRRAGTADAWAVAGLRGAPRMTVPPLPAAWQVQPGAKLTPVPGGIELRSEFQDVKGRTSHTYGVIYHPVTEPDKITANVRQIAIAVEISKPHIDGDPPHSIDLNYEQLGLAGTGWADLTIKPGRHVYRLFYKPAAKDTRPADRADRVWLRGDTTGRGRPIVIHEIRIYQQ